MSNFMSLIAALPRAEKAELASHLLTELADGLTSAADEEMDAIAEEREREMDADPAATVSHDEMLAFIQSRRRK